MKKIIMILGISILSFFGKAYAEMTYGVSAAFTQVDASGTETEGTEKNTGDADNALLIPSIFIEYAYSDAIAIGLDYIPMSADVSSKTKSRSDVEKSVTGTAATTSTNRDNKAQAELEKPYHSLCKTTC